MRCRSLYHVEFGITFESLQEGEGHVLARNLLKLSQEESMTDYNISPIRVRRVRKGALTWK